MSDRRPGTARRFRRRLTAVFVLVAAVSAGIVAVVTLVLAREYRERNFRSTSLDETRLALALAPDDLDAESFERLRGIYEARSDADVLAVRGDDVFTSIPELGVDDIPVGTETLREGDEPQLFEDEVGGRSMLVAAAVGRDDARYYVFFSLEQLEQSFDELTRVALVAWCLTVVAAGAVGHLIARRTLRPVAEAASVAEAIAAGDLGARLPAVANDEFGMLAASFNHMADEVQNLVRRLEEAAAGERRFTGDVAHELRTPLTGMSASASVLEAAIDDLDEPLRRPATILVNDVHRLRGLVLELLELARLDAPTDEPQPVPLRLRDAVEATARSADLRRRADVDVAIGDGVIVLADRSGLRRILSNLLDNAVVHGGGRVRIAAHVDGAEVTTNVIDDGPGVSPDDLVHIFDRFYKSDRSRATGGSGLGLAIAREHARRLGGDLVVSNEPGHGARFSLRLPVGSEANGFEPTI